MVDKVRWDGCISQALNGNLYANTWYLDIVSPGWCALVEDDYDSVFPLTVASKAGFKYIMQPYFTQQLGLFSQAILSGEKLVEFLQKIPSGYRYIDINLNTSNKAPESGAISDFTNIELDLSPEYEALLSGYQTNLHRNLKKADQNKLTLVKQVKPEDIISLFRANRGHDLNHLKDDQYGLIQKIADESIRRGIGEIWGANDENNQLVAAVLWVFSHQKAIFLFSALSETGKKMNAMPWLIDSFIRIQAGKPLILDFEGSNNAGLARFYSSFGSERVIYQRFTRNSLPYPLGVALKIWRRSRAYLNKYLQMSKQ
jgi:hypothetical protein